MAGQKSKKAVPKEPVKEKTQTPVPRTFEQVIWVDGRDGYAIDNDRFYKLTRSKQAGEEFIATSVLTEFTARMVEEQEISYGEAGEIARKVLIVEGRTAEGKLLPRVQIDMERFSDMAWVHKSWGAQAIIHAGSTKKSHAATAILLFSNQRGYLRRTVYGQTGWIKHPQYGPIFLTGEAVIGREGEVQGIVVTLPPRLRAYALPEPLPTLLLVNAIRASLDLLKLAPDMVSYVVFTSMFRPILGKIDTAVMLVGETGRFKTAFAAILFAHYGAGFSRKHLPDGWSSSAASLEQTAYLLADVVICFDDFKLPQTREKRLEELDKLRRLLAGAADGVGRSTLTQNREMRQNVYPRGLIFLTAEEAPQGESTVARSIIVPVSDPLQGPGNIRRPAYNKAEKLARDGVYTETMAGYVQYVAQHYDEVTVGSERHRQHIIQHADQFAGRHPRTGAALAELSYGMRVFLDFSEETGAITPEQARQYWQNCILALQEVAELQGGYVEDENPVRRFESLVNTLFAQGRIHLLDRKTGSVPQYHPEMVGWIKDSGLHLEAASIPLSYKTRQGSSMVGWTEEQAGQLWAYFLLDAIFEEAKVTSFRQQQTLPSKTALWAALRDAYLEKGMMRCESFKNPQTGKIGFRNRYRIEAYGLQGKTEVLALTLPLGQPLSSGKSGISGIEEENNSAETAN